MKKSDSYRNLKWAALSNDELLALHKPFLETQLFPDQDMPVIWGLETSEIGKNIPVGMIVGGANDSREIMLNPSFQETWAGIVSSILADFNRMIYHIPVWVGKPNPEHKAPSEQQDHKDGAQLFFFQKGIGLISCDSYIHEETGWELQGTQIGFEGIRSNGAFSWMIKVK